MADEQKTESSPAPTPEPLGNTEAARNPDGSIKDQQAPTPEKSSEQKTEEPKVEPKADAKAPAGAPEKYDLKAPEGYELEEKFAADASAKFKELGLSQEAAQALVDMYSAKAIEAAEAPYKQFESMRNGWRADVIKDAELGNGKDGLKPEVSATIAKAIDSLPSDLSKSFREVLTLTGAGDNPTFVKAFYNLAQRLGEGSLVKGAGPSPGGQAKGGTAPSPAQALFPNLPSSAR